MTMVTSTLVLGAQQPKRITLVGASIGKDWQFDKIGERLGVGDYEFGYVGKYSFDKSSLITQLLQSQTKPDIVLVKECSTYFPGDRSQYQRQIRTWVGELRAAGVQPVLVTVAPVEPPSWIQRAKNLTKRALGKPIWMAEIAAFNDWLRDYAARERLPLFDLEAALRIGADNRYMKPEFGVGDYVHLNSAAYAHLDREFGRFLAQLKTDPR